MCIVDCIKLVFQESHAFHALGPIACCCSAGVAVSGMMFGTTCLIAIVMMVVWDAPLVAVIATFLVFGFVDMVYLSANLTKVCGCITPLPPRPPALPITPPFDACSTARPLQVMLSARESLLLSAGNIGQTCAGTCCGWSWPQLLHMPDSALLRAPAQYNADSPALYDAGAPRWLADASHRWSCVLGQPHLAPRHVGEAPL